MFVAFPYYPRRGEWERLSKAFPSDHNYIVVEMKYARALDVRGKRGYVTIPFN